jgi:hypothetical protein
MADKNDIVLTYLMGVNLADQEANFRGVLENIAEVPGTPKIRDLVIATTAILMSLGGLGWPVIMRVMTHLKTRSDSQLQQDAVAIINGAYLVLPGADGAVIALELATLRTVPELGPAFVSTIYSMTAVWERTTEILKG